MDKEKYDNAYRTILSKLRRETYAEDKDPKYSLDNEHGQKVLDYVKKRLEKVKHNSNSGKKEEKMLFRTESLENLNVSEKCFNDIMDIVEAIIDETSYEKANAAFDKRFIPIGKAQENLTKAFNKAHEEGNKEKGDKIIKASEKINDFMSKKLKEYEKWHEAKKKMK